MDPSRSTPERRREGRREAGFSLVELMVVVLIVAILLAIGMPIWNSSRKRASDTAAKSLVMEGHRALLVALSDAKDLSTVTTADLTGVEPGLRFLTEDVNAEAKQHQVSVAIGNDGTDDYAIIVTRASRDGCVAVREREGAGTDFARLIAASACPATAFGPASAWGPAWSKLS